MVAAAALRLAMILSEGNRRKWGRNLVEHTTYKEAQLWPCMRDLHSAAQVRSAVGGSYLSRSYTQEALKGENYLISFSGKFTGRRTVPLKQLQQLYGSNKSGVIIGLSGIDISAVLKRCLQLAVARKMPPSDDDRIYRSNAERAIDSEAERALDSKATHVRAQNGLPNAATMMKEMMEAQDANEVAQAAAQDAQAVVRRARAAHESTESAADGAEAAVVKAERLLQKANKNLAEAEQVVSLRNARLVDAQADATMKSALAEQAEAVAKTALWKHALSSKRCKALEAVFDADLHQALDELGKQNETTTR